MEDLNEVEDEGQGCSSCIFSTSQWESCPRQGGQLVCIMNHTYFEEEPDGEDI